RCPRCSGCAPGDEEVRPPEYAARGVQAYGLPGPPFDAPDGRSGQYLDREDRAEDVGVVVPVELGLGDALDRPEPVDAGVVHEDVKPPERPARLGEQPFHIGGLRHVALQGDGLPARRADVGDDLVGCGLARGVVDHRRALGRQVPGDPGPRSPWTRPSPPPPCRRVSQTWSSPTGSYLYRSVQ